MDKDLTIIIPARNEEKYIGNLLESIRKQDYPGIAGVIIADAGSTDKTVEIVNRYSQTLNAKIVKGGLPAIGRNAGARVADTKYVLFVDSDCELKDMGMLSSAIRQMKSGQLYCLGALSACDHAYFWDNVFFGLNNFAQRLARFISPYAVGTFMLFDREKFWELGGFDENVKYAEDNLLSRKVPVKKFGLSKFPIYTSSRRFKNGGYMKVMKLFIMSFFSSPKSRFFRKEMDYWKK